jgi:hypothetical protein
MPPCHGGDQGFESPRGRIPNTSPPSYYLLKKGLNSEQDFDLTFYQGVVDGKVNNPMICAKGELSLWLLTE